MSNATTPAYVPREARIAGLRGRLISRLTGLSVPQLRHWHDSGLIEATLRAGQRGVPRLYSWVDYLRIQLASRLHDEGVPTPRIRQAVDFLDRNFEDWYLLPDPLTADIKRHVLADVIADATPVLADAAGQHIIVWPEQDRDLGEATDRALAVIASQGSLCMLTHFSDSVYMSPQVNLAQPSVMGTALETRFVARMAENIGRREVASAYSLVEKSVRRSIEFEEAVA